VVSTKIQNPVETATLHTTHAVASMKFEQGKILCERTECERRDEGESTYNQYGADDQEDKLYSVGRQGTGRDRDLFFRSESRYLPHTIAKANVRL